MNKLHKDLKQEADDDLTLWLRLHYDVFSTSSIVFVPLRIFLKGGNIFSQTFF